MRWWLSGAFAAVSLITAFAVYLFGEKQRALVVAVAIGVLAAGTFWTLVIVRGRPDHQPRPLALSLR